METPRQEWIPTRSSLLGRIRNPDDQAGWREFYDTYRHLVASLARRRGLTDAEVEDVTQDTMVTVMKTMSRFQYDPQICSFKSWLGRLADQRITDLLRRRPASAPPRVACPDAATGTGERLTDPSVGEPDAVWEAEWRASVLDLALRRFKRAVKPLRYQVFYLREIKGQSTAHVARALGIGLAKVYLENHRAGRTFDRIAAATRRELEVNETALAEAADP